MEKYHARIRGRATLYKKLRLHGYGLVYDKKRRGWEVKTDDKKWLEGLSKECHRLHLNCIVTPTRYTRSTTYRGAYFKEHPGILHHRYFCAYCGRLLPKKKITIDHLIPVQKASNEKRYRLLINLLGYTGVNDPKNLAPACKKCNAKKKDKGGLWILRGWMGRSQWFWLILKPVVWTALILLAVKLWPYGVMAYHFIWPGR